MAQLSYRPNTTTAASINLLKRWSTTLGIWGVGGGTAALFLLSVTPLVKREVLTKVPLLGNYYTDHTPASDKPF